MKLYIAISENPQNLYSEQDICKKKYSLQYYVAVLQLYSSCRYSK